MRFSNHGLGLGLSFFRGGFWQVFRSFSLRPVWFSIGFWQVFVTAGNVVFM